MPSFEMPERPKFEKFPQFANSMPFEELTAFCNKLYDQHKLLVDKAEPTVARKLLGGLHKDKIWALHHLRQLHEESQKEKKWQYCAALDSARSQALVSSIVKKLHRSILDPLNQVPQASMTRERLDEIRFAVQAVWNAEHELEQENDRQSRKELESSGAGTSMKEAFKRANGGESSQAA